MSEKIVQLNEEVIKGQIKELVRGSVEETLNELLEQEAEKLTQAARELSAAKAAKEQAISERQKKVDSAKADYTAIADKRQAEVVVLDEIIANYQAAKYFSDLNAAVSPATVDPTAKYQCGRKHGSERY